jgi:hypothetical protein
MNQAISILQERRVQLESNIEDQAAYTLLTHVVRGSNAAPAEVGDQLMLSNQRPQDRDHGRALCAPVGSEVVMQLVVMQRCTIRPELHNVELRFCPGHRLVLEGNDAHGRAYNKFDNSKAYGARAGNVNGPRRQSIATLIGIPTHQQEDAVGQGPFVFTLASRSRSATDAATCLRKRSSSRPRS